MDIWTYGYMDIWIWIEMVVVFRLIFFGLCSVWVLKTDVIIFEKHRLDEQWNKWVWCIGYGYGYGYGFLSVEKTIEYAGNKSKTKFSLTL
jgi:hypothetical protein